MLTEARFHRWSNLQGLMNPRKVMMNMKQRERVYMVLDLFTESIRQPSKAAHLHPHVKILSLNETGGDVPGIGVTKNERLLDAKTLRGAVRPCSIRIGAVNLDELREVDIIRERINHRVQIHLMSIRGELHAIRQAPGDILKKLGRKPRVSPSNKPADNK